MSINNEHVIILNTHTNLISTSEKNTKREVEVTNEGQTDLYNSLIQCKHELYARSIYIYIYTT